MLSWFMFIFSFDFVVLVVIMVGFFRSFRRGPTRDNTRAVNAMSGIIHGRFLINSGRVSRRYNKMEEKCRGIFERIFNKRFPCVRPAFLKNGVRNTNRNLELDGYCADIMTSLGKGVAFEYDGKQHSEYDTYYHRDVNDFDYQLKKDRFKTDRCRELGIVLIRIPHYVSEYDLERFIRMKLKEARVL